MAFSNALKASLNEGSSRFAHTQRANEDSNWELTFKEPPRERDHPARSFQAQREGPRTFSHSQCAILKYE